MSGTSADGIDAVGVTFDAKKPPKVGGRRSLSYPPELTKELHEIAGAEIYSVDRIAALARELGDLHAKLATDAIRKLRLKADFIALHGQTIRHRPELGYSWQLVDPAPVATATGLTVISDFRPADIAASGEAAPLVPFAHRLLFQNAKAWTAVVNIGGIANVTFLPPMHSKEVVTGYDTGPGNLLIDLWMQRHGGKPCDMDGKTARRGTPQEDGHRWLKTEPYFNEPPPKSTGRELFAGAFLRRIEPDLNRMRFEDAVATLTMFTAASIADQLLRWGPHSPGQVIVCGGGALNPVLLWALEQVLGTIPVVSSQSVGVDPLSVEAAAFAILGHETLHGRPSNVQTVTGAIKPAILGRISPGENYLKLLRKLTTGPQKRVR